MWFPSTKLKQYCQQCHVGSIKQKVQARRDSCSGKWFTCPAEKWL